MTVAENTGRPRSPAHKRPGPMKRFTTALRHTPVLAVVFWLGLAIGMTAVVVQLDNPVALAVTSAIWLVTVVLTVGWMVGHPRLSQQHRSA
ncbi:hypothetical protein [Kitasatospora sp. NPDC088346]|uniref:hypothetical protein n=1 Tax=Kitasatospora sp. NPDC088346 TaxID=3364073 RepID=UPI00380DFB11